VQGYREKAGMSQPIHPHLFRHQMLTYLTTKGLSDAQIQLISGHESKKSLEVYQHLSLESVDKARGPDRGDLKRFLWDFTYLCWANPNMITTSGETEPESRELKISTSASPVIG
jgi:hypothetical protein